MSIGEGWRTSTGRGCFGGKVSFLYREESTYLMSSYHVSRCKCHLIAYKCAQSCKHLRGTSAVNGILLYSGLFVHVVIPVPIKLVIRVSKPSLRIGISGVWNGFFITASA